MSYAVEKYGAKAIKELLDILVIRNGDLTRMQWREFLLRNRLINRNTTTIYVDKGLVTRTIIRRGTTYERVPEGKPLWLIKLSNTSRTLFDVQFWLDEIPDLLREVSEIESTETGRATG